MDETPSKDAGAPGPQWLSSWEARDTRRTAKRGAQQPLSREPPATGSPGTCPACCWAPGRTPRACRIGGPAAAVGALRETGNLPPPLNRDPTLATPDSLTWSPQAHEQPLAPALHQGPSVHWERSGRTGISRKTPISKGLPPRPHAREPWLSSSGLRTRAWGISGSRADWADCAGEGNQAGNIKGSGG